MADVREKCGFGAVQFGQSFGPSGFWAGTRGDSVAERVGPGSLDADGQTFTIPIASPALAHELALPGPLNERLLEALPQAVAWSAAAVASPVAGEVDRDLAEGLLTEITIKEL